MELEDSDSELDNSKVELIGDKINNVKNIIYENLSNVMEREEKLEVLVQKTDDLDNHAYNFQRNSKKLKRKLFYGKMKCYILSFIVICIFLWIFSISVCGIDYKFCKKKK